jgi:hypothetical protein
MLKLGENQSLAIEISGRLARLIVYNQGVENVCRKERTKTLRDFLQSDEGHLFKGRLQLQKSAGEINVLVKGELAGSIRNEEFVELVNGSLVH